VVEQAHALVADDGLDLEVLLVEDDPEDVQLLRASTARHDDETRLHFTVAERLDHALTMLERGSFDVVALDLSLPDARGLVGLRTLRATVPHVPVVVVTGMGDQDLARSAITLGAQDYLVKGTTNGTLFVRSLRYAVERHRLERERDHAAALLRQRADQLLAANARLRSAADARGELLAVVSHELRTPLTPILGFAQVLRTRLDGRLPAGELEMLEAIERNAARMQAHVEQLLSVSGLGRPSSTGAVDDVAVGVDLGAAVAELVVDQMGRRGAIEVDVTPGLAVRVVPRHLEQMLSNLVVNADKYGRPPIEVHAEASGSMAEIVVRDHGDGVPERFRPHLFERFRQASTGTRRTATGVGLGLYLVRQLALLNGGDLAYEPLLGQSGARFVLRLPVPGPPGPPGADEEADRQEVAARSFQVVARRLLHATDELDVARIVEEVVRDLGAYLVPFDAADDTALPVDVSLGLSSPMAVVPSDSAARVRLERLLPTVLEDARVALAAVRARRATEQDGPTTGGDP